MNESSLQDYFTIVKRPMDLSLIRSKLEEGEYNNPWEVKTLLFLFASFHITFLDVEKASTYLEK